MRPFPEVKCRSSGKTLQKKVAETIVTFGYDHRKHECFLLHVQGNLRKKKSLTTKDVEYDLVEEGNHNVTNCHDLRAGCRSGAVQV